MSDDARLIFQHIPKCAGTTVSAQLTEQVKTDPRFFWSHRVEVEGVGTMRGSHMPLAVIREIYPDALEKFRSYRSYAILREPEARFRSALGEYLRNNHRSSFLQIDERELGAILDEIIGATTASPVWLSERHVHFTRQADFVDLDGERLIDNLYAVEDLERLAQDLRDAHGLHVNPHAIYNSRKDKSLKFGLPKGVLDRAARAVWKTLPLRVRRQILSLVNRTLPEPSIPAPVQALLSSSNVRDFIADHYAPDHRLWEALRDGLATRPVAPAHTN
jgi:hypothetical protein